MSRNRDTEDGREVTGEVTGEVSGEVTGTITGEKPAYTTETDGYEPAPGVDSRLANSPERAPDGEPGAPEDDLDENGLPLTGQEMRERDLPVAAVPAGVDIGTIEAVEGFRLPEDQTEAEMARQRAEAESRDASRPEVAQQLADDAKARVQEAADEADKAQARADEVKENYEGPDRPPLHEGWRYLAPEPDPHDPA